MDLTPHVLRFLDANRITSAPDDLGDLEVADDDVGLLVHSQANANQAWSRTGQ